MRVAIVGTGRMGSAIVQEATRRGHEIVATIGRDENQHGTALTTERLAAADLVFEFTRPEAAPTNLERLLELGKAVVTGTTGWGSELPRLAQMAMRSGGALLHAPNFSIGFQLTRNAAITLARLLRHRSDFDVLITERHHRKKLDAPSGTSLALKKDLEAADPTHPYPIVSERLGFTPGTHGMVADSEHETITLTHAVRDRAVFATGAVIAGEWLVGRKGIFTFEDVIAGESP